MTYHKHKNKRKNRIKSVISTILIFLFAVVSSVVLVSEKKKLRAFDERVFYFVSASSSRNESLLDEKKELLKNLGGANVVKSHKGLVHLLANVYLEQESAGEIKSNISGYFADASILKIKSKRVSTKGIKKIKDIPGLEEFIKYLYKVSIEFHELQMAYLSGEKNESDFLSDMVDKRINLEKKMLSIEKTSELAKKVVSHSEAICLKMTSFLNGLAISKHKQNYVCNYFVGFCLDYVELFDCL